MVKIIYEYVHILTLAGYNATVLHEVKGFTPTWLKYDWVKDIKKGYLSEKDKQGGHTNPVWDFKPTDTIIIPDGFWEVMRGLYENKTLHRVVLCLGYSGLSTIDPPGVDWSFVGVTDVLCVSEQVKEDYKKLWPTMNYYVVGYPIEFDKLQPIEKTLQTPTIGLDKLKDQSSKKILL